MRPRQQQQRSIWPHCQNSDEISGNKGDFWDLYTNLQGTKIKLLHSTDNLQMSLDSLVNDMRESALQAKELEDEDRTVFGSRRATTKTRLSTLMLVSCDSEEELCKHRNLLIEQTQGKHMPQKMPCYLYGNRSSRRSTACDF